MGARAALLLLALAACDRVWQLDPVFDASPVSGDPDGRNARPAGCPASYAIELPSSSSYYRRLGVMSWKAAADDCADDRTTPGAETHLIVLSDLNELSQATMTMGAVDWWLGFSDRGASANASKENMFYWVTAEPTTVIGAARTFPWELDQPDEIGDGCAEVRPTGYLHDELCTDATDEALCECDRFPDIPANHF